MTEDRRVARAALCVSGLLLWLAIPGRPPLSTECAEPRERTSQGGWTLKAECAPESGVLSPVRGPARRLFGLRLDPNRADPASLEALPGIGPSRAAAIAEFRSSAPFCEFADLERVPGIGSRTLEKLSGLLEIDPAACSSRQESLEYGEFRWFLPVGKRPLGADLFSGE